MPVALQFTKRYIREQKSLEMTNFIFKSSKRLIKNMPLTEGYLMSKLEHIQTELRHQRQDHRDMSIKLEKLLIDKHLQSQVDDYFGEDTQPEEENDSN